jgi:hypothetical protein
VTFNVYRGTSSGGETQIAGGLTTTNFTDGTVTDSVTYYYVVTENNSVLDSESPPSGEVSAEPEEATSSFAYISAVVSNRPTACWRFSETNGTTAADSAGGYNGTYGAAAALGNAGPRPPGFLGFEITNTAVRLAGNTTNSWITIPALNLNTNTVTITAWIYPIGSQADYAGLFFCRSGSTVAGMNYNSAGTDLGYTWNNDGNTWGWSSGVQPPTSQWSLAALVVQPASTVVYLFNTNGQESATNFYSSSTQAFAGTGTIGTDTYAPTARVFNGLLDEVTVYQHALTPAQLQQLYDNGHQLSQVQVGMQTSGGNLKLTWPQGTLLEATQLAGPWQAIKNADSWLTVPPTNSVRFFRASLP